MPMESVDIDAIDGYPWILWISMMSMDIHEYLWLSIDLWISMDHQWISLGLYGLSKEIHGLSTDIHGLCMDTQSLSMNIHC